MRAAIAPVALIALLAVSTAALAQAGDDASLRASASRLAALLTDGDARADGDADIVHGPDDESAAVVLRLVGFGGGNGNTEYLAFYARNVPSAARDSPAVVAFEPWRLVAWQRIGGKGDRDFAPATARWIDGDLHIEGRQARSTDGLCCPTRPIASRFRLSARDAIEETPLPVADGAASP